jgi:hypothetical protein
MKIFCTIRDSTHMGVPQYNYKNGAFISKIFKETPGADALNILISSEETTPKEKSTLKAMPKIYISFRNRRLAQPQLEDTMHVLDKWQAFGDLFTDDAKACGMYVPPTTFQTRKEDATVAKTFVLSEDGTESVIEGGIAGVPPGAPEEYVKAQAEKNKLYGEAAKNTTAQAVIGNSFTPETVPSALKEAGTNSSTCKSPNSLSPNKWLI